MKARVIVNPQANKGNCVRRWPHIKAELEKHMGPLSPADVVMTAARNHASELAREAAASGCERIISVGGDGTLNEVLNGLIVDNRPIAPNIVLAQVPGGTSNELSRSFGHLPLGDACRAAVSPRLRPIDVFRVEAKAHSGQAAMRYGFLLAIAGAAATISWRAQRAPLLKRLGPLSYVIMTVVTTFSYSPRSYRIAFDDEAATDQKLWSVLACSFDGAGEGLALAPGADSADGHFDVITVGDVGRWEALTQIALKLADGSYLSNPNTRRRKASRVTLDADHVVLADVDGENLGTLPMRIEMLPFRVNVAAL
jgi:YegS/Rv2252/BmrU family lipid kinase